MSAKGSRWGGNSEYRHTKKYLLSKWLFKLINEEGLWQDILKKKYVGTKPIAHVQRKPGDSHFWGGLMKVKETFLNFGRFHLNNGTVTEPPQK
jgi:hypothetical protein